MTPFGQMLFTIAAFAMSGTSAAMTERHHATYAIAKQRASMLVGTGTVFSVATLVTAFVAG